MKTDVQLKAVAEKIRNGAGKIVFFCGAGISTGAGIPDFRSPETGLYANLKRLNLPYPEAVFDIDFFRDNPKPFYALAEELYPGRYLPTKFHYMLKLFEDKGVLKRVYTQNIDTLERLAGVSGDLIVEAHGSFAANHCIDCNDELSIELLREDMDNKENGGIPKCRSCEGYVKPDIVFFGEGLPSRFFDLWEDDCDDIDVAIVAGTSLTVHPFASLPSEVYKSATRLLINREIVGDFKRPRKNDFIALESCDVVAESFVKHLGWEKEFIALLQEGEKKFNWSNKPKESAKEEAEKLAVEIKELEEEKEEKSIQEIEERSPVEVDDIEILISKLEISAPDNEEKKEETELKKKN